MSVKMEPVKTKTYNCGQSKHVDIVPHLPRISLILGPYGSDASILLQNMIPNIDKGCFESLYI